MSFAQIQVALGTTIATYQSAVAKLRLTPSIEDVGDGAHLMWLGPKRYDRVLLYLHGGGFLAPLEDISVYFWRHVQQQLKDGSNGFDLGIVFLHYALIPEASSPTPLHQTVRAIKYMIADGLSVENLHIAGDSAGANLAVQLLLHCTKPVPSIEPFTFPRPLRGIYLMSPWLSFSSSPCHFENTNADVVEEPSLRYFGDAVLDTIPESYRDYIEPLHTPDSWFKDGDFVSLTSRILITAGGRECMRDDIVKFHDKLKRGSYRGDLKLVVQERGVHNDMFMDFLAKETPKKETQMLIDWLASGYSSD